MNVLLLGKDGQVGRELQRTLLPFGNVRAMGRENLDLTDVDGLRAAINCMKPELIVNAAAYTAVDKAESDEENAYRINCDAVAVMAECASKIGARLIHYSTDYVFDGEKRGAYVETDPTNPQSTYGRSKRAGEEAIGAAGCESLIFRTSWVFSVSGKNFVKTVLRLARERETLDVVADQHGAPTSAELIAEITELAIAHHVKNSLSSGIYHLASCGETTWYDLACHIVTRALGNGEKLQLNVGDIKAVSTESYPLPAKRPKNSRLDTTKLSKALGLELPDWTSHVNRAVDQLTLPEVV